MNGAAPRGREPATVLRRIFTPAGVIVLTSLTAAVLAFATRSWHVEPSFYEVAAQVIPVFLLVAVVEGRFFIDHPSRSPRALALSRQLLSVAVLGEVLALTTIARGHDDIVMRTGVLTGLIVVIGSFLVFAFHGPARAAMPSHGPSDE